MTQSDFQPFVQALVQMHALYPNAAPSEATHVAWFRHLEALPLRAVQLGFERAPSASPNFCPTAEQVKAIAEVEATAIRIAEGRHKQQMLLPPPEVEKPDEILNAFYK